MPTTANNETLERIRAGKLAIENDGTKEQLQDITTLIWPNDGYPSGNRKYYQTKPDEGFRWLGYTYTNLPTIKATELLAMMEQKDSVTQLKEEEKEREIWRDSFAIGFANWLDIQTIYLISNNTNSQLLELYKQSLFERIKD